MYFRRTLTLPATLLTRFRPRLMARGLNASGVIRTPPKAAIAIPTRVSQKATTVQLSQLSNHPWVIPSSVDSGAPTRRRPPSPSDFVTRDFGDHGPGQATRVSALVHAAELLLASRFDAPVADAGLESNERRPLPEPWLLACRGGEAPPAVAPCMHLDAEDERCAQRSALLRSRVDPTFSVVQRVVDASAEALASALAWIRVPGRRGHRRSLVVQTRRATGGEPALAFAAERKRRTVSGWRSLSGPGKRVGVGQRGEYPVRRGAEDSDCGVSPTHRGRAGSARRSRASRTFWSRSGRAERAW
jgi:hypothetical protein